MATVTVLISTFNREKMIVDALQSVFAQTYTDYEVLVIDDGSTDHTERTLQTWMSKIRYQKKANKLSKSKPRKSPLEGLPLASLRTPEI